MRKVIIVLLATSLIALQAPTTEAFIFDFMGKVLTLKGFFETGINVLKSIRYGTKQAEDKNDTDMLLEQIKKNMDGLRHDLKGNFTAILANIDQVPGIIWAASIKESFQNVVDEIGDVFQILAEMQFQTNKNIDWISGSDKDVVANYETDLQQDWRKLQHYLFDGKIMDLLKKKEANDVCETGISHLQLLERSLNQYMSIANQYMFAQHIIYNIREHIDHKNKDVNRQSFNRGLQRALETDVGKIKSTMKECSTEYWLCDPAQLPNTATLMPTMKTENKQGSSDCGEIQKNGYQCIPSNNNRNCNCIKSTMAISLVWAKADPGYVITGAQMKINGQLLMITANQAKLLPNGQIDKTTIKPVTRGKEVGKRLTANFVIKKSMMHFGKVEISQNRFMTAVGFQQSIDDSFYISAESTRYDFEKKTLVTNDLKMEQFRASSQSIRGTTFARAIDIKKDSNGRPTNIKWTDRINPLIDTRLVQSASPGPLSGVGLFLRGKSEKDGFLAIKINTYDNIPLIPKIPSLNEFPIQEALKSLSDSTSLLELERKYGKL